MATHHTQVGIVGGGPAGLLLARLLHRRGIACVVLERRSRLYVESRIRAGVLEQGTVAVLEKAGAAGRLASQSLTHGGVRLAFEGDLARVDLERHAGSPVTVYGQTEVTRDLNELNLADGVDLRWEAPVTALHGLGGEAPVIAFEQDGRAAELRCEWVAGCDGFHGVSRQAIPADRRREYEQALPVGWLGVLSPTTPVAEELVYACHPRGFALCSQRSRTLSRNYIEVPAGDTPERWSGQAFWDELRRRLPQSLADTVQAGEVQEKSIAPLRSFVCEPMRHGRLFLVGDAAHIVPPTGAKGLNLAVADAAMLASALSALFLAGNPAGIDNYSATALARAWQALRFSWWFTRATHRLGDDPFALRMQAAELAWATGHDEGRRQFARQYVGLPITDPVSGTALT